MENVSAERLIQFDEDEIALIATALNGTGFGRPEDYYVVPCLNVTDWIRYYDLDRQMGVDGYSLVRKLARITSDQGRALVAEIGRLLDRGALYQDIQPLAFPEAAPMTEHQRAWQTAFVHEPEDFFEARNGNYPGPNTL